MTSSEMTYGRAVDVAEYLHVTDKPVSQRDLQAALINALYKIDKLQSQVEELKDLINDLSSSKGKNDKRS